MSVISDFFKFKSASGNESDQQARQTDEFMQGGRRQGENENPYLSARRTWNDHMRGVQASRTMWQLLALLCLLIALAAVGGVIAIGSQSKFIPYVVQVNKLGEAVAVTRADIAGETDPRVVHASLASFINDLRMVTPDVALQRKAIFRAYAMLSNNDPATAKANQWFNGSEASIPFKRAETQTVNGRWIGWKKSMTGRGIWLSNRSRCGLCSGFTTNRPAQAPRKSKSETTRWGFISRTSPGRNKPKGANHHETVLFTEQRQLLEHNHFVFWVGCPECRRWVI